MRRRALLLAAVAALALSAGCAGVFGGGAPSSEQVNRNATYRWDTTANVTVTVLEGGTEYQAVLRVGNRTSVPAYTHGEIEGDQPLDVAAVRYRYPNGTVVRPNGSTLAVRHEGSRAVIDVPQRGGRLAYTAPATPKQVRLQTVTEGSHEVILPPAMRTEAFLFGSVAPGGYETSVDDRNRLHLTWEEVRGGSIDVRYYLERDFYIFAGFAALAALVAVGGAVYYRLQIRRLERRREAVGLDVEGEDDRGRGPS